MPAYFIAAVTGINDPDGFQQYREQVQPLVEQYGGRYLVGSDQAVALEGNWKPIVMVIIEFESMDQLQAWYDAPEYQPLKQLRQRSVDANITAVDGL